MPVQGAGGISRRPSLHNPIPPSTPPEPYSDSRFHGQSGPSRYIRFPGVASYGGGAIAKSEDGQRCVVAGRECTFPRTCLVRLESQNTLCFV